MRILSTRRDLQVDTSNISPDRSQILKNMTSEMTLDSNLSELDYKKHEIDVRKSLQFQNQLNSHSILVTEGQA